MDISNSLQESLYQLRAQRNDASPSLNGDSPGEIANNIIADVMNLLETLFVMINYPAEGFVSMTPESTHGAEEQS